MRKHPQVGFRILSGINFLQDAAKIVLHHQERYDGTGYPAGLRGDSIVLGARIFAVADTLDCVTSARPFQSATTFEEAREIIVAAKGKQFDPIVVNTFAEIPVPEWKQIRHELSSRTDHGNFGRDFVMGFENLSILLGT